MRLIAVMPAPIRLHSVIELPAVPRCGEPGAVRRLLARGRLRLSRYPKLKHNMNINLCNVSKKGSRWPRSDLRTACRSASWRNVPGYRPRLCAAVEAGMVFRSRSGWPGTPPSPPLAAAEVRELCPVRAHDFWAGLACARHAVRAQPGNVSRSTGKDPHSLSGQTLTAVTRRSPGVRTGHRRPTSGRRRRGHRGLFRRARPARQQRVSNTDRAA